MSESLEHKQMKDEIYDFLYNLGCSYIGKEDCGEPKLYYYLSNWYYGSKRSIAIADVYAIWHGFKIWVEVGEIKDPEKLEALRSWEKEFGNIFVWIPYGKSVRGAMRKLNKSLKNIPKSLHREITPPKLNIEFVDLSELTIKKIEELTEEHNVQISDGIVRISKIDDRALEAFNRVKKEQEKRYGYHISRSITYWVRGQGVFIKPHELPFMLKYTNHSLKDIKQSWAAFEEILERRREYLKEIIKTEKPPSHLDSDGKQIHVWERDFEWYKREIARRKEIERHARMLSK